jgi:tetraacyldisaccharide 4'-kinase
MISRAQLATSLMRLWQQRSWRSRALLPLAWLYGALLLIRRALYALGLLRQTRLPVPVIVVGNIFVGGTGKTPLVVWLVEQLRTHGWHPGVIARGYGARIDHVVEVHQASDPMTVGDEPLLIKHRTGAPVAVSRRRVAAAQQLLRAHPEIDVVIADDGLQHYALARTIEIQLSDTRGHGNGWLLPAGPLREPASRRADFFVVNSAAKALSPAVVVNQSSSTSLNQSTAFSSTSAVSTPNTSALSAVSTRGTTISYYPMQLHAEFAECLAQRADRLALVDLPKQKRIIAAAGIGHPQRFFDMLRGFGIDLADTIALPDHFDYQGNPFQRVDADIILITEKDAVKCERTPQLANDARLWVVPVTASIAGPLIDNLLEILRGRAPA